MMMPVRQALRPARVLGQPARASVLADAQRYQRQLEIRPSPPSSPSPPYLLIDHCIHRHDHVLAGSQQPSPTRPLLMTGLADISASSQGAHPVLPADDNSVFKTHPAAALSVPTPRLLLQPQPATRRLQRARRARGGRDLGSTRRLGPAPDRSLGTPCISSRILRGRGVPCARQRCLQRPAFVPCPRGAPSVCSMPRTGRPLPLHRRWWRSGTEATVQ